MNIIHTARAGDCTFSVEVKGLTRDADPTFYGYAYYDRPAGRKTAGMNWDENRIVTFIGGDDLNEEDISFLTEAGFTLPGVVVL